MADNLPRPWPEGPSPTPWSIERADAECVIDAAGGGFVAQCENPEVARLVRSLPEWVERADTYKAERDALERRMDAVRAEVDRLHLKADPRHRVAPMWLLEDAVTRLRAVLDGDGEA